MRSRPRKLTFLATSLLAFLPVVVCAQSTGFTYQGKLTDGANAANGNYDLQFALFDNVAGGNQIGSTLTRVNTIVSGGIFTVQLDFGVSAFPGANRFLEIGVRPASVGSYTILTPRQQLNSTPYAIRTLSAATADTANNSTQLGGVAASQYVQTNDSRLSDSRSPTPGSANYIQNTTTQQSANFNISGNGTVGGNLGIGTNNPTSRIEIAAQDGLAITGFQPFLTLRDTFSGGKRSILAGGNGDFGFYPNSFIGGVPAVIIKDNGNVGIGTGSPQQKLAIVGPNPQVTVSNPNGNSFVQFFNGTGASSISGLSSSGDYLIQGNNGFLVVTLGGNVGIGTISPQQLLHVNGRARIGSIPQEQSAASVCFNSFGDLLQCGMSSLRFKTNVKQFVSGLDIIRRLRPISFDWKDGTGHDIGLGAEDVAKIAPSFTFTDKKGEVAGVKYERLNMLLINAVKEQQKQIERLTARLRAVERNRRRRVSIR